MKQLIVLVLFTITLQLCIAPPVTKNKDQEQAHNDTKEEKDVLQDYMEYHRYLRQVVNALESDTDFRDKLEKADETDIKSGKIAHQLEFVSHHVRSRLDELKRTELARLKELTDQKEQLTSGNRLEDPLHHHLDNSNPHTFEIEDLKRLIVKTTADLADADRQRRDEFKEYELQKEYEKQEKLNHTENGEEREKLEKEYKQMEEQHKKHEPLHEPGHKAQFEEVWEEQDHMQQQDFDPKAFFMLHDLDGNKLWDQEEVKALFIKELDKLYQAGAPEDDMRERVEEMERMRESVFGEMDINRDGFIDYNEFIAQTQRKDYQQDNGWQGIDEQKPYTHEELEEYISKHHGMPDYQGGYYPPQGHPQGQPQYPPHPNDINYGQHQMPPSGQQLHPGQMPQVQLNPQQVYQQVPPQMNPQFNNNHPNNQQHLNTNEIYRNQPPQQPPPQQQQQQHPNAVPNGHYTNQQYQQNQQANNQQYHQQKQANHNQQYQQQQQQQVHYNQQQQKQPVVNQQQKQPVVNQQQPIVNQQQQPIVNQQQPVANQQQQQPIVNQQQPIVNQQQPIVNQQKPIVNQQQPPIVNQQNIPISNEIKS